MTAQVLQLPPELRLPTFTDKLIGMAAKDGHPVFKSCCLLAAEWIKQLSQTRPDPEAVCAAGAALHFSFALLQRVKIDQTRHLRSWIDLTLEDIFAEDSPRRDLSDDVHAEQVNALAMIMLCDERIHEVMNQWGEQHR
jgi:hypothetical protein